MVYGETHHGSGQFVIELYRFVKPASELRTLKWIINCIEICKSYFVCSTSVICNTHVAVSIGLTELVGAAVILLAFIGRCPVLILARLLDILTVLCQFLGVNTGMLP